MLLKDKIFLIIWLKWRLKPRENIERHKKENVTIAVEGLIKKCFNYGCLSQRKKGNSKPWKLSPRVAGS